jgi:hypothetical protein
MSLADDICETALAEVGTRESGENNGIPLSRYGLPGDVPGPWCARYCRWVLSVCGVKIAGNQYELGRVQYMEERCKELGWMIETPERGCLVFFKNRIGSDAGIGRHVGFVVEVKKNLLVTCEGNTSNKVAKRSYPWPCSTVAGFARPKIE